jgi:predicted ATP-dependent endonuclease of OLD family
MPKIQDVNIHITDENRKDYYSNAIEVIVNDGNATNIEFKGDGVKSLAAIALLKENALKTTTPIIIIEEPEVHLHPEAINQLNSIISGLSENNQVIVTTHNPLFVVRDNISSNVIVGDGIAKPAKNLKEIRDILGVKASDNLIDSKYVLVVEGEDDKEVLKYILPLMSGKIEKAMKQNLFTIHEIGGAGNLSYKLSTLQNMIITYSVLLDDDTEGRTAYGKAERDNLVSAKNVTFTTCIGMGEAEFEDCIKPDVYVSKIKEDFSVDLLICSEFRNNDKWSNRIQRSFKSMGKPWNDTIEKKVKFLVVDEIKKKTNITEIFIPQKITFIRGLILTLENMIKES